MNIDDFKTNLTKTAIVSGLTVLIFVTLEITARFLYSENTDFSFKWNNLLASEDQIQTVILGSSWGEKAFDLRQFDHPVYNACYYNQDLYYDQKILEKLLNQPNRIEHVILVLGFYSFGMNEINWAPYMVQDYLKYADIPPETSDFFLSLFSHSRLYPNRSHIFFDLFKEKSISNIFVWNEDNTHPPMEHRAQYLLKNGWRFAVGTMKTKDLKAHAETKNKNFSTLIYTKSEIHRRRKNLDNIIDMTSDKRFTIVIPPFSHHYLGSLPEEIHHSFYAQLDEIKLKHKDLRVLDSSNDIGLSDRDFYDYDHLNITGAEKFTRKLLEKL